MTNAKLGGVQRRYPSKLPKPLSPGEEQLATHLRCYQILAVREYKFDRERKFRADFFIQPDLLVEVEGGIWTRGRHSRGNGMEDDMEKYNTAVLNGFRLLRFSTQHVMTGFAIDTIRKALNR